MSDAATEIRVSLDAGERLKLNDAAVARAKRVFGTDSYTKLAEQMGFTRNTFYRLRAGRYDIRLSKAAAVASQLGWTIDRTFTTVPRG